MEIRRFTVNPYKWSVIFIKYPKRKNLKEIKKILRPFEINKDKMKELYDQIKNNTLENGGHFIYNNQCMLGCIILYKQKNKKREMVALMHEKRHLEDHILDYCNIRDYEAAGYLAGWLMKKLM